MSYYEFPHSRTYDQDLGWLIEKVEELQATVKAQQEEIDELKKKVEGDQLWLTMNSHILKTMTKIQDGL